MHGQDTPSALAVFADGSLEKISPSKSLGESVPKGVGTRSGSSLLERKAHESVHVALTIKGKIKSILGPGAFANMACSLFRLPSSLRRCPTHEPRSSLPKPGNNSSQPTPKKRRYLKTNGWKPGIVFLGGSR